MAFSTQKDFFNIPFMDESAKLECKNDAVKLKRYESTADHRSWARDETQQSKFLSDLVTCQHLAEEENSGKEAYISSSNSRNVGKLELKKEIEHDSVIVAGKIDAKEEDCSTVPGAVTAKKQTYRVDPTDAGKKDNQADGQLTNLMVGDSLLTCANTRLAEYQKILNIKTSLEEDLATVKKQNKKIEENTASKLDSNTTNAFFNKIKKFAASGKLSKDEENEMLGIYQKMENMNNAYEKLQSENYYLKRLMEKLMARVTLDAIIVQPEESQDIGYLQKEITSLRKECTLLRQIEDEYYVSKQQQENKLPRLSEQDVQNIKVIMKERNSLREKCKSFKALEEKVKELTQQTLKAKTENGNIISDLNYKAQYINKMEAEMQDMQKYYEDKCQKACLREECLKAQLEDLKADFIKAKCEAQKTDMLTKEVNCLRKELLRRNLELNEYDCQYKQLMEVVGELQAVKLQCLQDSDTQTCTDLTEELAFYTHATLEEIAKELRKKICFDGGIMATYGAGPEPKGGKIDYVESNAKTFKEEDDCEKVYSNALTRLKELEAINDEILKENQSLNEKLSESEEKMVHMLEKIENLDVKISRNEQEANKIGEDLQGTIGLVKDISDVQLKNQQLANAVSAINSRDDQKIIDDLRSQLEAEQSKLKSCQEHNLVLLEDAKLREKEMKELRDINNKLNVDKTNKLLNENNKLARRHDISNIAYLTDETGNSPIDHSIEMLNTPKNAVVDISDEAISINANRDVDLNGKGIGLLNNFKSSEIDNLEMNKETDSKLNKAQRLHPDKDKSQHSILGQDETKMKTEQHRADISQTVAKISGRSHEEDKQSFSKQKLKDLHKNVVQLKVLRTDHEKDAALDDFVSKKSERLKINLQRGRCFEKEFRSILDDFIRECSYCFCLLLNSQSKLYAIGHKLCHSGLNKLSFRELAYLHKKIYAQADKLLPGCLLDMILSDHKEQVEQMLKPQQMPRLTDNNNVNNKISETNVSDVDNKCCCCRSLLCCDNSEEMLKDKVKKLEKDIEIAREYLDTLKHYPQEAIKATYNGNSDSTNNSTFRASSAATIPQKSRYSKHLKILKTRVKKQTDVQELCMV